VVPDQENEVEKQDAVHEIVLKNSFAALTLKHDEQCTLQSDKREMSNVRFML
jgi:hypothetical protein